MEVLTSVCRLLVNLRFQKWAKLVCRIFSMYNKAGWQNRMELSEIRLSISHCAELCCEWRNILVFFKWVHMYWFSAVVLSDLESAKKWDCWAIFSDFIVKEFWRLGISKLEISKYHSEFCKKGRNILQTREQPASFISGRTRMS